MTAVEFLRREQLRQGLAVLPVALELRVHDDFIDIAAGLGQGLRVRGHQYGDMRLGQVLAEHGQGRPGEHEVAQPVVADDEDARVSAIGSSIPIFWIIKPP